MQSFIFKYYNYRRYVIISYCSTNQRIFHIECNHLFSNIIIIGGMLLFLIAPQIKEYFTLNAIIYFQSYNYRRYVIISYCSTNQIIIFHIECNHLFSNIIIIEGMLLFLIAPQIKEYSH